MSFYDETLKEKLQEKIAYFRSSGLNKEADLLLARLKSMEKSDEKVVVVSEKKQVEDTVAKNIREKLQTKLATETRHIPELEKQYILKNLSNAQTLKELKPLRIAYMERLLKIKRASRSKNISFNAELSTGPYNNEKIFCDALQLIYSQDPLWIEDLKELYFSIMPVSSATATSKSPL